MKSKPISPRVHGILDYALIGGMLVLPSVLGLSKKVKTWYLAEGLVLLGYAALTDQPVGLKPLIPFRVHAKIDPMNVAGFALQTMARPFREDKKARIFNLAFTALAGITVLLTDWKARR